MKRRHACIGVLGSVLGRGHALAQQSAKVFRIGSLFITNPELAEFYSTALLDRLRELGWQPGINIVFERRYAGGDLSRVDVMAAELVNAKVDVIIAYADSGAQVVRRATSTIPIVAVDMTDPVGRGLAASLGRPGGNVTGVAWTSMGTQLFAKPLQFLRELRPRLSRVAALHRTSPAFVSIDVEARESARSIGIALECIEVPAFSELDTAFAAVKKAHAEALLFWPLGDATGWHATVAKWALDERLPSASQNLWYVRGGGLLGYGPPPGETWRRAADYIDKILRGANPGELPIDQPTRFDLVVNRRTAAALGIELPRSLLLRATEVIE